MMMMTSDDDDDNVAAAAAVTAWNFCGVSAWMHTCCEKADRWCGSVVPCTQLVVREWKLMRGRKAELQTRLHQAKSLPEWREIATLLDDEAGWGMSPSPFPTHLSAKKSRSSERVLFSLCVLPCSCPRTDVVETPRGERSL